MKDITIILPYYRAPKMLEIQVNTILQYPDSVKVIVVDDGSPEPAFPILQGIDRVSLYRIEDDIPWNREGARNLGAKEAKTEWIIHMDIDHILPPECVQNLFSTEINEKNWYRFKRFRVGFADDTRKKDSIPDDMAYGEVKPHIDSYLCTKKLYWDAGGYNEEYSGCLGGGGPFLKQLRKTSGKEALLFPGDVRLEVYTRSMAKDSSVWDLSRDNTEFKKRRKIFGIEKAINPLRFNWHRLQ